METIMLEVDGDEYFEVMKQRALKRVGYPLHTTVDKDGYYFWNMGVQPDRDSDKFKVIVGTTPEQAADKFLAIYQSRAESKSSDAIFRRGPIDLKRMDMRSDESTVYEMFVHRNARDNYGVVACDNAADATEMARDCSARGFAVWRFQLLCNAGTETSEAEAFVIDNIEAHIGVKA
jgi:hypothetical protein